MPLTDSQSTLISLKFALLRINKTDYNEHKEAGSERQHNSAVLPAYISRLNDKTTGVPLVDSFASLFTDKILKICLSLASNPTTSS